MPGGYTRVAAADGVVLAIPIEHSGADWFTLEWGGAWLEHLQRVQPAYAKVLVRDNPAFPADQRRAQFGRLRAAAAGLARLGVPMLYELLVPATDEQTAQVHGDADAARAIVTQARADGRDTVDCVVLGRAAARARLEHWLQVAAPIEGFVGFAIGRSIWDSAVTDHEQGRLDDAGLSERVRLEYLCYARTYLSAVPLT